MKSIADFAITSVKPITQEFAKRNIFSFSDACSFIRQLPYGRNQNKIDLKTVLNDHCGTCSTKHALLKLLAIENDFVDLKLIIGIFRMNGTNTPPISQTLQQHRLSYIPEAHCYLKLNDTILDFTKQHSKPSDFVDDLLEEIEILPSQITNFKVNYHKDYLDKWLKENEEINLSLSELWVIREQCINDLAG